VKERAMAPDKFIALVDAWIAKGGQFHDPDKYAITTAAEVDAICRALDSQHIFAANSIHTPAFFYLTAYLHHAKTKVAVDAFRAKGLDRLRRIFNRLLDQPTIPEEKDFLLRDRYRASVFILQVLAAQKVPGDGSLIVRGARDRRLSGGSWSMVFEFMERGHSDTWNILEALRDPLPEDSCGDCYLYWSNKFAATGEMLPHPFATKEGIARLARYVSDSDIDDHYSVCWAVRALPFVDDGARSDLLDIADRHSDGRVRLEAAAVRAQTGSKLGAERLIGLCLDPRLANEAIARLETLGLSDRIPAQAREPGFQAMAEMCTWLSHPNENGRPPDEIAVYDTRALNWPPTGDRRQLWILKYRYEPDEWEPEGDEGVGLVGSTTFSLFFVTSAKMKPEEIYALHCCWELRMHGDPAAPKDISAEYGQKKLAEANPGFGTF
jgi:hypothetical protein